MDIIDYITANIKKRDTQPVRFEVEKIVSSVVDRDNKKNIVNVPDIEEIEKNILSEYTTDSFDRARTRRNFGLFGSSLLGTINGILIRKSILERKPINTIAFLALYPFVLGLGYLLGHQIGANYVNVTSRRSKKKIVVGYDSEKKPITVEVFAPKDLKNMAFYENLLQDF